ncbi:MAG: class I SAM-dependent methyltransferase [Burkholderiales bacterium]|nr:class I SAM-dependent methyltransferase [Burkholderiales bacterium]
MDGPDQVAAYAQAGRIDGVMSAAYLYHTASASQVIQSCGTVVDLGCGPATQLVQIAQMNPDVRFVGIDLSSEMLAKATAYAEAGGVRNVEFRECDITRLTFLPDQSIDGVISTMALHHLPTLEHLRSTFSEIRRILRPNGAVYLTDFGRLKKLASVIFFAYLNARHQPHLFSLDYERSLRAAFLYDEFEMLAKQELPPAIQCFGTFLVPMLTVLRTPPKPLKEETSAVLRQMRSALPRRYRADLDDLRFFFRLSGMSPDPFS